MASSSVFAPAGLSVKTAKAAVNKAIADGYGIDKQFTAMSQAAQRRFTGVVLASIQSGEGLGQLAARISGGTVAGEAVPGFLKITRAQSMALAHTAVTAVSKQDRLEAFRANADIISAVQQLSTLDNRTTEICIAYSDLTWDIKTLEPIGHSLPWAGGPPRHFNCRSVIIPVVKSPEELGVKTRGKIPVEVRASMDGQVPASTTFGEWLGTKTREFIEQVLGKDKAKLFIKGKLKLVDLINFNARPLSVSSLSAPPVATAKVRLPPVSEKVTKYNGMEFVSIDDLKKFAAEDRRLAGKSLANITERTETLLPRLTKELKAGGKINEPLVFAYDSATGKGLLIDGNTRLVALEDAGFTHAPIIVNRQDLHGFGVKLPKSMITVLNRGYVLPSELGLSVESGIVKEFVGGASKELFASKLKWADKTPPGSHQLRSDAIESLHKSYTAPVGERSHVISGKMMEDIQLLKLRELKGAGGEGLLGSTYAQYEIDKGLVTHLSLRADSLQNFYTLSHEFGHHVHLGWLGGGEWGTIGKFDLFGPLAKQYSKVVKEYRTAIIDMLGKVGEITTEKKLFPTFENSINRTIEVLTKIAKTKYPEVGGVTSYAHVNEAEWFAESWSFYFGNPEMVKMLKSQSPETFKFFDMLLEEYGG